MSLVISILYFKNPFTGYHWLGTALVFSGTLLFAEVPQKLMEAISGRSDTKKITDADADKKKKN